VLDACCGGKAFWFDKNDERAMFMDVRAGEYPVNRKGRSPVSVKPDIVADFSAMPFPNGSFNLVVFDPPHFETLGASGTFAKTYGRLIDGWRETLSGGFAECFRVLKPGGTLIFKWCEWEIPVREVLALTPEKPLFGHISGKRAQTHWICFLKS
jgi:SAM-dependent methyltransferase